LFICCLKGVQYKQEDTNRYAAIGKIERWPMPASPVKVEGIDDITTYDTIEAVAECTTQNQAVTERLGSGSWFAQHDD
jgi:hypothetical protein